MPLSAPQRVALTVAATDPAACSTRRDHGPLALGQRLPIIKQVTIDSLRRAGLIVATHTGGGHIATVEGIDALGDDLAPEASAAAHDRWQAHYAAIEARIAERNAVQAAVRAAGMEYRWGYTDTPERLRQVTRDAITAAERHIEAARQDLAAARTAAEKADAVLRAAGL